MFTHSKSPYLRLAEIVILRSAATEESMSFNVENGCFALLNMTINCFRASSLIVPGKHLPVYSTKRKSYLTKNPHIPSAAARQLRTCPSVLHTGKPLTYRRR